MAALTMAEAAKSALNNGETKRAGVISYFARSSGWLNALGWLTIPGGAYRYDVEGGLPAVAFRGMNEGYTSSVGVINPQVEALRIVGGDLDVDTAQVKMYGPGVRSSQEAMKAKAMAAAVTTKLIKGDSESNPREFDGLQKRIGTGSQLHENSSGTGDPLSLFKLDTMIASVSGPNRQLWLPKALILRLSQAARNTSVGGFISHAKNEFGQVITSYNGIPLIEAYPENDGVEPLAFDEAASGGGSTSTSIYCVSVGDGYVRGIQNGTMEVRDLGEIDDAPVMRTRVEWLAGLLVENGRGVARLRGITNAAVTA